MEPSGLPRVLRRQQARPRYAPLPPLRHPCSGALFLPPQRRGARHRQQTLTNCCRRRPHSAAEHGWHRPWRPLGSAAAPAAELASFLPQRPCCAARRSRPRHTTGPWPAGLEVGRLIGAGRWPSMADRSFDSTAYKNHCALWALEGAAVKMLHANDLSAVSALQRRHAHARKRAKASLLARASVAICAPDGGRHAGLFSARGSECVIDSHCGWW